MTRPNHPPPHPPQKSYGRPLNQKKNYEWYLWDTIVSYVLKRVIIIVIRGRPLDFWGGGGGGGWFWKKISCKCICIRKKFLHKTIVPKKIHARTVGWKKNSGKMFSELTHWTLSISRLLKDFSIWTWVLIKEGFVTQNCVFLGCLYLYINSTCGFQYSYIFCWIQITTGVGT